MADPTQWSPKFDEEQVRGVIDQYNRNPQLFDGKEEDIEVLEEHAYHYKMPFTRTSDHQDNYVAGILKSAGRGFAEGFTTLPLLGKAEPKDTWEAIANNLGHLAGFVGYLPGGKAFRKLGILKRYTRAAQGIRGKSVPMQAANFAQKKVGSAIEPILKDLPDWVQTGVIGDMAQGAFHLGAASAVSSWTHGVDEIMHSAGFGAVAGGVFRGIGNLKHFGKRLEKPQLKPNGSPDFSKMADGQKADLALRTIAGAAFQGLPSTLQGATTEEQVYAYAMGSFFGYKEVPYQTRTSREFLAESFKEKYGPDPELNPTWDKLTPEMKKIVKADFKEQFQYSEDGPSESSYLIFDLLSGKGIDLKAIEKQAEEYAKAYEIDPVTGEVNASALSKKEVEEFKNAHINDPIYADPSDLDKHVLSLQDIPGSLIGKNGQIERLFPNISTVERIDIADKVFKKWKTLHNEDKKPIPKAEQKITEFIKETYGRKLEEDEIGWWRRWAESTRKKKWVEQIEIVDGQVGILNSKTNSVGNKKDLSQEPLIIEDMFRLEHEKVNGVKPDVNDHIIRVLDHVVWEGKEHDLGRAIEGIKKQEISKLQMSKEGDRMSYKDILDRAEASSQKIMEDSMTALHERMWKDGYYYFGGKGDAKKKFFIKIHPAMLKKGSGEEGYEGKVAFSDRWKRYKNRVRDVFVEKEFEKDPGIDIGVAHENVQKRYRQDYQAWRAKNSSVKNPREVYDRMFVSNVLYEVSNNGFTTDIDKFNDTFSKLLNSDKYINTPKDFNKRAQIWFNSGLSANPEYIFNYLNKLGIKDFKGGSFRVGMFSEKVKDDIKLSDMADQYGEISDGAIIARPEIIDALNHDKGLPLEGRMNKSFIVEPDSAMGALLGKYAIQAASPKLEQYMRDNKIHMLLPESAVKQAGERKNLVGDLTFKPDFINKKYDIDFSGDLFDLKVNSFRTVMSEITANKMLYRQQLPKQLFSVLSQYGHKNVDPKVIKDMYETLSGKALKGTPEGVEILDEYLRSPVDANMQKVVDNIDSIPVNKLFELIRDPKHPKLSQKLYEKILKVNHETVESLTEEGEMTRAEMERYAESVSDYESIIDRLNKVFPDGSIGAYMHKFSRDYRMQAMRNYAVQKLTRPKIDNSASARMRPWDIAMQMPDSKLSRLQTEQDIFFLDNNFKEMIIRDEMFKGGRTTLEKLFEDFKVEPAGVVKDKMEQILHGLVMRVPMDSMSGAHSLKFAGFTGVDGLGALLHPRTMKALGGADLDGDKATIFFGGESSGFKQKWREMYHAQKDEYVEGKGAEKKERHNKNAPDPFGNESYGEQLAVRSEQLEEYMKHPMAQYSPYWRERMSTAAAEGRDRLKEAVTGRMAIIGAYNAVRSSEGLSTEDVVMTGVGGEALRVDGKKDGQIWKEKVILNNDGYSVPFYNHLMEYKGQFNPKLFQRIHFTPKTKDVDLQRFREMARAAIALGSDPMNEAGLRGELFTEKMLDTLFNIEIRNSSGTRVKEGETVALNKSREDGGWLNHLKSKGPHKQFLAANNVLYGKNSRDGRRWNYSEIQNSLSKFDFMPTKSKGSFLPSLADSLKGVNWSDNVFRHINERVLNRVYLEHGTIVRENDWLREIMGRDSMQTKKGKFIQSILDRKLYTDPTDKNPKYTELINSEEKFIEFISETHTVNGKQVPIMGKIPYSYRASNFGDPLVRRAYLEHLLLKGEDFLVNDLSDMASMKSIIDVIKEFGINGERVSFIHKNSDDIKSRTVQYAKQRKALNDILTVDYKDKQTLRGIQKLREAFGLNDKAGAIGDQIKTDAEIRGFKEKHLSPGERDLFDMLYMGTYSKGDKEKLNMMENLPDSVYEKHPELIKQVEYLRKTLKNTALIRAGLTSKEISDKNLKTFFKNYDELLKKSRVTLSAEQEELLLKETEKEPPITSFKDDKGNLIEGKFIDANLIDAKDKKYLDEVGPFKGLHQGKIKDPELQRVFDSLTDHLSHYHNIDAINLNGFFRALFKKDINQATKVDLQGLDNVFKDMRSGSWWRETMESFFGKDKYPRLKKAYYNMFPKTIDRELLRSPAMMEWVEDVGPYKDKLSNTIENARTIRPTAVVGEVQRLAARTQELSMQKFEQESEEWRNELSPVVSALEDGDVLFKIAVANREHQYMIHKLRPEFKRNSTRLTEKEMDYEKNYQDTRVDWNRMKKKVYIVPTEDGNQQMTGEQVVRKIDKTITKFNEKTRKWLTGDKEKLQEWLKISEDSRGAVTWPGLDKLRLKFHDYIMDTVKRNKSIPIEDLGIDGLRQIVKRVLLSNTPHRLRDAKSLKAGREGLILEPFDLTGNLGTEFYFPHMSFNRTKMKRRLSAAIKKVSSDPTLAPEQILRDIKKLTYQYAQMTGDFMSKDEMGENFDVMQTALSEMAGGKINKARNILTNDMKKVGNQFSRDSHIGGWELTPEAYESYMRNSINTFYKQAMQVSARTTMFNFNNRFFKLTGDKKLTQDWMDYFRLYTQSAMGYPIHIPEKIMNDPDMKIKGTAYKWFADSTAKKRIDHVGKMLGVNRKELEKMNLDEKTVDELSGMEYSTLQKWGAWEAKWQLASLLAHPKSSIANLYGGTVHTWISAGYENLKKARNFEYLKTHINPEWKSMKDVEKWMQELGIIEEFLIHEAGLNPKLKAKKTQNFIKEAIATYKKDPDFTDEGLLSLSKKHGITDRAFQAAASFMRVPERILRRDSFMAHYLQAKNQFGGAIKDYNSPFLINFAKRGVKGTQFLYSAPFRPMWTNSTLGRVMSRFQLWSWNSVRFRNDVLRRAEIAGYREGTDEFETFKRLAQADLFMLGLSNLFMYSLFENALPAPWNWFQDTADLLFGNEQERDRAFYGSPIGPLQAVTPPVMRLLPPMFKGMMSGDYSQLADYYLWTIPPFGRLIRDVVGPGGAIENPYYAITKFTGMPVMQIADLITDEKKGRDRGKFIYG